MVDQVSNFKKVNVSIGYDAAATSIVLSSGEGAELPDPSGNNYNLIWWDSANYGDSSDDPNHEIVRVTALSTDTLTVTRNQESSGASTKNTSGGVYKMILGPTAKTITDLQVVVTTSVDGYMAAADKTKLDGIEALADVTDAVNIASSIVGVVDKPTPVDADSIGLIDSAATNSLKELTWANVKATLKAYFDSLYDLQEMTIPSGATVEVPTGKHLQYLTADNNVLTVDGILQVDGTFIFMDLG